MGFGVPALKGAIGVFNNILVSGPKYRGNVGTLPTVSLYNSDKFTFCLNMSGMISVTI